MVSLNETDKSVWFDSEMLVDDIINVTIESNLCPLFAFIFPIHHIIYLLFDKKFVNMIHFSVNTRKQLQLPMSKLD